MVNYIIKRLVLSILVIFGVSILIFTISRIIPGDPARLALGPRATAEAVEALRKEMNLDEPLLKQYVLWLKDVLNGDLGRSLTSKRPVSMDIKQFLPATIELMIFAALLMVIFAFLLGILSAKYKNSLFDGILRIFTYTGIALPAFVVATLLLLLFGFIWEGVIPVLGRLSPGVEPPPHITGLYVLDSILSGRFSTAWDAFLHLLLPATALCLGGMVQNARLLRSSLIDNMTKEYITVSKSFGLPTNLIMRKYLLKPSSVSVVTVLGMDIASLCGNAFLVENIFNWPGLSRYGINSMLTKDLNSIVAVVLIIGVIFLIANFIVDLITAALDPRIRLGGE
ncbi:ABC transporter permease [Tepidimicrobium xylanilyticum]|uniref:Peptide/nickel transport system permease protein n=1 Tax=Tepidimicrobium xylanilyticum TaxID=1123352 RepID=A0A1H3BQM3_9FIRM|nr:ABC transporter permease [Tepidimicrobium xylanilyticum]SDX44166.1 peptide/nickel transport system permease protein [Tepidimicrobium xylanilyticum]